MSRSKLSAVGETLLTPLWARAYAGDQLPELGFVDPHAVALIVRTHAEPGRILTDTVSMAGMVLRTLEFDRLTRRFLDAHPDGLVVSAGVGLCARNLRLGPAYPRASWVGIDREEVVRLRRDLMEAETMPLVTASVGEPGFLTGVDVAGRATLVLAEGLLMYLTEAEVEVFLTECARLPAGSQVVADIFHPMVAASGMHPISWTTGAPLRSGAADAAHLAHTVPGFRALGEFEVLEKIGQMFWWVSSWTRIMTWGGRLYCVAQLEVTGEAA